MSFIFLVVVATFIFLDCCEIHERRVTEKRCVTSHTHMVFFRVFVFHESKYHLSWFCTGTRDHTKKQENPQSSQNSMTDPRCCFILLSSRSSCFLPPILGLNPDLSRFPTMSGGEYTDFTTLPPQTVFTVSFQWHPVETTPCGQSLLLCLSTSPPGKTRILWFSQEKNLVKSFFWNSNLFFVGLSCQLSLESQWWRVGTVKIILCFYSVNCLVRWIIGRIGKVGRLRKWWPSWLSLIIKNIFFQVWGD